MTLSKGERLILWMLADIQEHLGVQNGIEPKFLREVIGGGHLWALEWQLPGIFAGEDVSDAVVRNVVDHLDMWSFIEASAEQLNEEEKGALKDSARLFGDNPTFPGYDGNSESEHRSVARVMIDHLDRFESFAGRDLNSHMPSVDTYDRMFGVFKPIRPVLAERLLNVDELAAILNERVHPSNR